MARRLPTTLKRDRSTDRAFVRYQGKKHYFGHWGSQKSFEAFARWLREQGGQTAPEPVEQGNSISDCVGLYLDHAVAYYGESQEYRNLRRATVLMLKPLDPAMLASDYGPRHLKDLQRRLAAEKISPKRKRKPQADATPDDPPPPAKLRYARTTINQICERIRRCFRWCVSEELIPASVLTALETVPGLPKGRQLARESTPVTAVSWSVVAATMPHMSPTIAAMVQVQALCGMRPQDVCQMTTGTIEMRSDIWLYRPAQHKNTHRDQALVKGIPAPAQAILRPLLRHNLSEPLFSPIDSKAHWGNLPTKKIPPRTAYTSASYGKAIKYSILRATKAGDSVPHWAPNQLRHAIATELRRTHGLEAAQVYLGHAKPDTTLIYAERTIQALVDIAKNFVSPLAAPPGFAPPPAEPIRLKRG